MKKLTKTLQNKSIKELIGEEKNARSEIAKLRLEAKSNPPKDTNTMSKKRKNLAVLLTIMTQKRELEALSVEDKKNK